MEWFKKHTDTALILGAILSAVMWMNGKFNNVENRLTKIETIMYIKGLISHELASKPHLGD